MLEHWFHYLTHAGAHFAGQRITHFENQETRPISPENSITDLSYLGLLKIEGADATSFLQGQFTNDVRQVNAQRGQFSAWCTPKGRVFTNFRLIKRENAYYLLLPQESIAATLKRLKMYVLRAKVAIMDASDEWVRLGITGQASAQVLSRFLNQPLPTASNATGNSDSTTVLCVQSSPPRYLLVLGLEKAQTLWHTMAPSAQPVAAAVWQLFDILAGLPQITPPTAELFIPQMLNLQALDYINFKKGCYTGQEIVARVQYLTAPKQRLYLVKGDFTLCPQSGEALYTAEDSASVGQVINAEQHPQGGVFALAVIQVDVMETGKPIYLSTQRPLQRLELPYTCN